MVYIHEFKYQIVLSLFSIYSCVYRLHTASIHIFFFFFESEFASDTFFFQFSLLYNIVLVLPHINMNPPWVYTYSPSWAPIPPPSPYHPSVSSQCTSPKLDAKILNKIVANWIQQNLKESCIMIKRFISDVQWWFTIHKSNKVIYYVNRIKDKNYMTMSIDAEKDFDKI